MSLSIFRPFIYYTYIVVNLSYEEWHFSLYTDWGGGISKLVNSVLLGIGAKNSCFCIFGEQTPLANKWKQR